MNSLISGCKMNHWYIVFERTRWRAELFFQRRLLRTFCWIYIYRRMIRLLILYDFSWQDDRTHQSQEDSSHQSDIQGHPFRFWRAVSEFQLTLRRRELSALSQYSRIPDAIQSIQRELLKAMGKPCYGAFPTILLAPVGRDKYPLWRMINASRYILRDKTFINLSTEGLLSFYPLNV